MKICKQIIFTGILLFLTIITITCTPKKTETQNEQRTQIEKSAVNESDKYSKILNGDLSAWEGTWVNGYGNKVQLKPNGTFNEMEISRDFQFESSTGNNYMWENAVPGEFAYNVYFFPIGIEFVNYYGNIQTDITKDRIYFIISAAERTTTSNDVYYREGEGVFSTYHEAPQASSAAAQTIQIGLSSERNLAFWIIHDFEDEGNLGSWIVITSDYALEDFSFIAVDYDYEIDSWIVERTLYTIPELKSSEDMEAFQVNTSVGDGIPTRGISFTDRNTKRYFYISESGFDGSLLLSEFQLR